MKRTANKEKIVVDLPESAANGGGEGSSTLAGEPFVHVILLIAACMVTYCNSMLVPFTFDDYPYLVENPLIRGFGYLFDHSLIDNHYLKIDLKYNFILRPITYFTFTLNNFLTGVDPGGFRLVNILLHVSNALLVYLLIRQLLACAADGERQDRSLGASIPFIAFFSAMIFAVHPLQTQAVTYIIQRFTSLATLLYLLTLVLYLSFRSSRKRNTKIVWYVSALLAAICAMKAKEIAFTLPVVLLMVEICILKGEKGSRLLGLVPFMLTMAIIPATVLKLSELSSAVGSSALEKGTNLVNFSNVSSYDYFITQLRVIVTYLRLLFLPVRQNLDYDYPLFHSFLDYRIVLSVLVIISVVGVGIWFYRRAVRAGGSYRIQNQMISFGIFWFFITLAVESSIIPIDDLIYEHRVYLPSVGMILAVVSGMDIIRLRMTGKGDLLSRFASFVPVLVVLVLSTATIMRNEVWKNIWVDAAEKSPHKARPFINQGDYLMKMGRSHEAIPWLKQALDRDPVNIDAQLNLGTAYSDTGSFSEALEALNFVVERRPGDYMAWNNLGTVYARNGDCRTAVEMFRKSLAINPGYTTVRLNLERALKEL